MRPLFVFSDGSGEERVGRPGGWAFVVVRDDEELARGDGRAEKTTCLLMELEAARAGLAEVVRRGWHEAHAVVLVSDSSIVLDVAAGRFRPKPVALHAATDALHRLAMHARASTRWVRAHAGHRWNEVVDVRARQAREAGR
ncbi:MAG: RNase H family protein [Myxococcota bacterium]